MKLITFVLMLFIGILFSYSQNTYVPDDNFEQALIDLGYDSGALDDYVPTGNINTVINLDISSKNIFDLTGIEDFISLEVLNCNFNQLNAIDFSQNSNLYQLQCAFNQLTSLNLTNNLLLSYLECGNNQLTSLDLINNLVLNNLYCYNNSLTTLNVSANISLTSLDCYSNQLSTLDVSQNNSLVILRTQNNLLTSLNLSNGNNTNFIAFDALNNINLTCIEVDNAAWSTSNLTNIDSWASYSENCTEEVDCVDFTLENATNNISGAEQGDIVYGDVDGDNDMDILFCGFINGNRATVLYKNDGLGNFVLDSNNTFVGVVNSYIDLIDVDGDTDLDIFICGSSSSGVISNLYLNDGLGNYLLDSNNNFIGAYNGAFSDIDLDGDLDLLLMNAYDHVLYSNDSSGLFTPISNTPFNNFFHGTIDFKDFNNDGYKDLLLTGQNVNTPRTPELYLNNGSGNFSLVSNLGLDTVGRSAIAFSDTNNDGFLDILLTGNNGSLLIAKLFENNGNATFTEVLNTSFESSYDGTTKFADFDNDGDDDVLITGRNVYNQTQPSISKIYENLGNNSFVLKMDLDGVAYSGSVCVDLNNDNLTDIINIGFFNGPKFYLYFNECQTASIDSFSIHSDFKAYPNPVKNMLFIESKVDSSYQIYDRLGRFITKGNVLVGKNNITLDELSNGVYFIRINSETKKIIKN